MGIVLPPGDHPVASARPAGGKRQRATGLRDLQASDLMMPQLPAGFALVSPWSGISAYDALRFILAVATCAYGTLLADTALRVASVSLLGFVSAAVLLRFAARQRPSSLARFADRAVLPVEMAIAALSGFILPAVAASDHASLQLLVGNALGGGLVVFTFLAPARSRAELRWKFVAFSFAIAVSTAAAMRSSEQLLPAAEAVFGLTLVIGCAFLEAALSEATAGREKAQHDAEHDHLTGLLNRKGLERAFGGSGVAAKSAGKTPDYLCLLYIDLDGFKDVNDSHGHPNADRLLRLVAERIHKCFRASDPVARFGGDEFVVLMRHEDVSEVVARAQQLLDSLLLPFLLERSLKVVVSASIGIAVSNDDAHNLTELMRLADKALYEAKAAGKAAWRMSKPERRP